MTGVEQVALGGGGRVWALGALDGAGQTQVAWEWAKMVPRALTQRSLAQWGLPSPGLSLHRVRGGWHQPSLEACLRPLFVLNYRQKPATGENT